MEDSYPYLPALENVKTSERELWFISAICFQNIVVFVLFFLIRQYLYVSTVIATAVLSVAIICLSIHLLFRYVSFKTDTSGLTMRRIIGRKYLKWEDIDSAWNKYSKIRSATCLYVKSGGHVYELNAKKVDAALLSASVRQHLMTLGRANQIEFDDLAKSLWTPIPDTIPEVISFGKALSTKDKVSAWMGLLFIISLVFLSAFFLVTGSWRPGGISAAWFLMPLFLMMLKAIVYWLDTMLIANSIKIDSNGIEAQSIVDSVTIDWDDVSRIKWFFRFFFIYADKPKKSICMGLITGDKESEHIVCAVIRRLRSSKIPQALIIPNMISTNPEMLMRPTGNQTQMQMAYINSLEEPAKSKIRNLSKKQENILILGLLVGVLISLSPLLQNIVKYIHDGNSSDVHFFFALTTMIFFFPIFTLMLVLADAISNKICRRFAAPYAKEWDEMRLVSSGSPEIKKTTKWITYISIIITIIFITLCSSCFFRVSDNNIVIGRFGSFSQETYNWNEIKSITNNIYYSNQRGHTKKNYNHIITFASGTSWVNDSGSLLSGHNEMDHAISFISKKSKVRIRVMYH